MLFLFICNIVKMYNKVLTVGHFIIRIPFMFIDDDDFLLAIVFRKFYPLSENIL